MSTFILSMRSYCSRVTTCTSANRDNISVYSIDRLPKQQYHSRKRKPKDRTYGRCKHSPLFTIYVWLLLNITMQACKHGLGMSVI